VRGAPRPVRLMPGCDYAAQCHVVGHKGATATQPCVFRNRTLLPSKKQAVLDPSLAPSGMSLASCTSGRRRIFVIGWPSMAPHCLLERPAHLITTARMCGVLCWLKIRDKPYQFHCTPRKEFLINYCDLRSRWSWWAGARLAALLTGGGRVPPLPSSSSSCSTRRYECVRLPTMGARSSGAIVIRLVTTAKCSATRSWARFWSSISLRTSRHSACGALFERHSTARAPFQPKRLLNSGRIQLHWLPCLRAAFLGSSSR